MNNIHDQHHTTDDSISFIFIQPLQKYSSEALLISDLRNRETVPVIEFRDPRVRPGEGEGDALHEELLDGQRVGADLGGHIVLLHDYLQGSLPTDQSVGLLSHLREKTRFMAFLRPF